MYCTHRHPKLCIGERHGDEVQENIPLFSGANLGETCLIVRFMQISQKKIRSLGPNNFLKIPYYAFFPPQTLLFMEGLSQLRLKKNLLPYNGSLLLCLM